MLLESSDRDVNKNEITSSLYNKERKKKIENENNELDEKEQLALNVTAEFTGSNPLQLIEGNNFTRQKTHEFNQIINVELENTSKKLQRLEKLRALYDKEEEIKKIVEETIETTNKDSFSSTSENEFDNLTYMEEDLQLCKALDYLYWEYSNTAKKYYNCEKYRHKNNTYEKERRRKTEDGNCSVFSEIVTEKIKEIFTDLINTVKKATETNNNYGGKKEGSCNTKFTLRLGEEETKKWDFLPELPIFLDNVKKYAPELEEEFLQIVSFSKITPEILADDISAIFIRFSQLRKVATDQIINHYRYKYGYYRSLEFVRSIVAKEQLSRLFYKEIIDNERQRMIAELEKTMERLHKYENCFGKYENSELITENFYIFDKKKAVKEAPSDISNEANSNNDTQRQFDNSKQDAEKFFQLNDTAIQTDVTSKMLTDLGIIAIQNESSKNTTVEIGKTYLKPVANIKTDSETKTLKEINEEIIASKKRKIKKLIKTKVKIPIFRKDFIRDMIPSAEISTLSIPKTQNNTNNISSKQSYINETAEEEKKEETPNTNDYEIVGNVKTANGSRKSEDLELNLSNITNNNTIANDIQNISADGLISTPRSARDVYIENGEVDVSAYQDKYEYVFGSEEELEAKEDYKNTYFKKILYTSKKHPKRKPKEAIERCYNISGFIRNHPNLYKEKAVYLRENILLKYQTSFTNNAYVVGLLEPSECSNYDSNADQRSFNLNLRNIGDYNYYNQHSNSGKNYNDITKQAKLEEMAKVKDNFMAESFAYNNSYIGNDNFFPIKKCGSYNGKQPQKLTKLGNLTQLFQGNDRYRNSIDESLSILDDIVDNIDDKVSITVDGIANDESTQLNNADDKDLYSADLSRIDTPIPTYSTEKTSSQSDSSYNTNIKSGKISAISGMSSIDASFNLITEQTQVERGEKQFLGPNRNLKCSSDTKKALSSKTNKTYIENSAMPISFTTIMEDSDISINNQHNIKEFSKILDDSINDSFDQDSELLFDRCKPKYQVFENRDMVNIFEIALERQLNFQQPINKIDTNRFQEKNIITFKPDNLENFYKTIDEVVINKIDIKKLVTPSTIHFDKGKKIRKVPNVEVTLLRREYCELIEALSAWSSRPYIVTDKEIKLSDVYKDITKNSSNTYLTTKDISEVANCLKICSIPLCKQCEKKILEFNEKFYVNDSEIVTNTTLNKNMKNCEGSGSNNLVRSEAKKNSVICKNKIQTANAGVTPKNAEPQSIIFEKMKSGIAFKGESLPVLTDGEFETFIEECENDLESSNSSTLSSSGSFSANESNDSFERSAEDTVPLKNAEESIVEKQQISNKEELLNQDKLGEFILNNEIFFRNINVLSDDAIEAAEEATKLINSTVYTIVNENIMRATICETFERIKITYNLITDIIRNIFAQICDMNEKNKQMIVKTKLLLQSKKITSYNAFKDGNSSIYSNDFEEEEANCKPKIMYVVLNPSSVATQNMPGFAQMLLQKILKKIDVCIYTSDQTTLEFQSKVELNKNFNIELLN